MTKTALDITELASETAMAYVENLANQLGKEHSDWDEEEECGHFKPEWQAVYDEIYDIVYNLGHNYPEI